MSKKKKNPVGLSQLGVKFSVKDKQKTFDAKVALIRKLRDAKGSQQTIKRSK